MADAATDTLRRLGFWMRRYAYQAEALARLRGRGEITLQLAGFSGLRLPGAPGAPCLVHLHGMGDDVRRAFRDGILTTVERCGVELVLPEIGPAPWCAPPIMAQLRCLLRELRAQQPARPLLLSGTSMGGCIALALSAETEVQSLIAGVAAFSATARIDRLAAESGSPVLRATLARGSAGPTVFTRVRAALPWFLAYTAGDPVVPPFDLPATADRLRTLGARVRLQRLVRPAGHFRPIKRDWHEALAWLQAND